MARKKPALNFAGSLEVDIQAPLDARTVVPTKADLTIASNYPYAYKGLPVYVEAEQKVYVLTDLDTTDVNNWKEVGSGDGNTVSVELTQAEYDALTPEQKNNGTVYFITDGQGGGGGRYVLPIASASTLGGVKVGTNLSIDANGVLSATGGGTVFDAGTDYSHAEMRTALNGGNVFIREAGVNHPVTKFQNDASEQTLYIFVDGGFEKMPSVICHKWISGSYSGKTEQPIIPSGGTKDQVLVKNSSSSGDMKWEDAAGLERVYSMTERKVGTYLGKDLYEVTLTGMTIQGGPSSGQVTWYNLTTQKNIQRSWTIVDFESLAADGNSSSATKYVNQILIVRGGGNGDWNVGNSSTTPMYVRSLTLRYVKEAL